MAEVVNLAAEMEQMQVTATVLFALAVVHTFCVKKFLSLAHHAPAGSMRENLFHFLGEVEVVFGVWAALLISIWSFRFGTDSVVAYLEGINFTEPTFVFAIMCMSATRPVMSLARVAMARIARALPVSPSAALYCTLLIVGPLLGSLITEPAAMTVTALLLKEAFFDRGIGRRFSYATLGLLFVNISIGGTLTHFAAPPVLMVARPWGWDTPFMLLHFGDRAAVSIFLCTVVTAVLFRGELRALDSRTPESEDRKATAVPWWMSASHLFFIALTVLHSHHMSFFIPLFLLFLGWTAVSKEYQDELRIRESLLVAFFLGGLVTLGQLQSWWLQPTLIGMSDSLLFWGAIALTAVTDNAALTYLGTLVPTLSDGAKLALVGGAVTGGGLTVIANAPNPAGYSILASNFGEDGISPLWLFVSALPYTLVAAAAMHFI